MKKIGAILLDTRSIQKYVFASNKLKTNAGASYLVDSIFKDLMEKQILAKYKMPPKSWRDAKSIQLFAPENADCDCEIIQIGGGNMFILVNGKDSQSDADIRDKCKDIVKAWSRAMLVHVPGVKTGAAVDVLELRETEPAALSKELNSLLSEKMYKQLKENQNTVLPQVDLPYTGLTLECDISGKTATERDYTSDKPRWISAEVAAKIDAFKFASDKLNDKYADILQTSDGQKFVFANEFDKLGYKKGESYICVIHIDGNNMGLKFGSCDGIQERKDLSMKVASVVEDGFRQLLSSIVAQYPSYKDYLDLDVLKDEEHNVKVLPIRPIIIGGDDVTFVCAGRLGITYAQKFIEAVNSYKLLEDAQYERMTAKNENVSMSQNLSCCGGIAIVPAKYPFFRAYELAEQLCSIAKKKSRSTDDSLIDFAILHGDMYSSIDGLRQDQYQGVEGGLHYGPYIVAENKDKTQAKATKIISDKSRLNDLLKLMQKLTANMPENKIKKLREVLTQGEHSIIRYLELSDDISAILSEESKSHDDSAAAFWQKKDGETELKTRYIDAIEIMDFMPKTAEDSAKEAK